MNMNICESPNFLRLLIYLKELVDLIKVGAAVVLVIAGTITFAKAATSADVDIPKAFKKFASKLGIACLIFLLPGLIEWFFFTPDTNEIVSTDSSFNECANNMNWDKIAELEQAEEDAINKTKEEYTKAPIDNNFSEYETADGDTFTGTIAGDGTGDSSGNTTLATYVAGFEGTMGDCNGDSSKYVAKKEAVSGKVTVGHGITNGASGYASSIGYGKLFPLKSGTCYAKSAIDAVMAKMLETQADKVRSICSSVGVDCNNNQVVALTDIYYNTGNTNIVKKALKAYKSGGNDAAAAYIKKAATTSNGKVLSGLVKRRASEANMFTS